MTFLPVRSIAAIEAVELLTYAPVPVAITLAPTETVGAKVGAPAVCPAKVPVAVGLIVDLGLKDGRWKI